MMCLCEDCDEMFEGTDGEFMCEDCVKIYHAKQKSQLK